MADLKISQLTGATTPLAGTEVVPIVQSGSTKKVAVSDLTAGRAVSASSVTATGTIQGAIVNAISGTGDQLLVNVKTNDATTANNAGLGLRANSSATAANRFAQLWFDADGANLSGGDYFIVQKNGNDGSADLINYSNATMRFGTNYIGRAAIDLTIGTTGDVTVNTGNLIQGTAAKGVNFTANTPAAGMTSQLLNWYEEGTWTPAFSSTSASFTYTFQVGAYVKVGKQVTLTCSIKANASGTVTNGISITGLPFAAASTTYLTQSGVCGYVQRSSVVITGFIAGSTIYLTYGGSSNATPTTLGINGADGEVDFQITYIST
jgi:hypothetical protein